MLRSLVYLLAGGRTRWFRASARTLTERFATNGATNTRDVLRLGEVVEVGLAVDPGAAWAVFRATALPDDLFALAFPHDRVHRIARHTSSRAIPAVRVCLAVTERSGFMAGRDAAARALARLLAVGAAGDLVLHLDRCTGYGLVGAEFLDPILADRIAGGRWDDDPAWVEFFARVPDTSIPPLFEVHRTLGRVRDCARLARSAAEAAAAVRLCLSAPDPADIELGLDLARRAGRPDLEPEVRRVLAAALARAGRWADALPHYEAVADRTGQSRCHEQLGDLFRALELGPDGDERRVELFDRCVGEALDGAGRGAVGPAAARLTKLRGLAAGWGEAWAARLGELNRHRAALLTAARANFEPGLADLAPAARRARLLEWAGFEEGAEEWAEAAIRLEQTGEPLDRIRASRLWERDHRYGAAVAALGPLAGREDVQVRTAELRAAGGDHAGAARVYEHAGRWAEARREYEAAGEFGRAADCAARLYGTEALDRIDYLDLMARADRVDDVIRGLAARLEADPTDRGAAGRLRSFVRAHGPRARAPQLVERSETALALTVARGTRSRFDARIGGWLEAARAGVLARYAGIWGLDLGTSKSAVSLYDLRDRRAVVCPYRGQPHFPSTLAVDERGGLIVGLAPEELLRTDLVGAIERSKRQIGTGKRYRIRGTEYGPEEVAAHFIRFGRGLAEGFVRARIRDRVEELARTELGDDVPAAWLDEPAVADRLSVALPRAVVTIPAYFDYVQRAVTRCAVEVAGVELVRLVPEPTAACFSLKMGRELDGKVLVVDLGAGTTDLSYLDVGGGLFSVLKIFGDTQFGSSDFDTALTAHFVATLARDGVGELTTSDQRRLRWAVEQLKADLSANPRASFDLVAFGGRDRVTLELTAAEFERIAGPLLEKLDAILAPAKGLPVDHLLLVGAPMRSPVIRGRIERVLGKRAAPLEDPRTAVALGAGCNAGYLSNPKDVDLLLLDIVPFALGVLAKKEKGVSQEVVNYHIRRGQSIPRKNAETYTTDVDNQDAVDIRIVYGLGDTDDPAATKRLAVFRLDRIPPAKAGEPKIEVTFEVDTNGVLLVSAKNVQTGKMASHTIRDAIWPSPVEIRDLKDRLDRAAISRQARDQLGDLARRARTVADELEEAARDRADLRWRVQFDQRGSQPGPAWAALDPEQQGALGEMFNRGGLLADQFPFALDAANNAARKCREFAASAAAADAAPEQLAELARQGEAVVSGAERGLSELREQAATFRRWSAVLTHLALTTGDPRDRVAAAHAAGEWTRTVRAFEEAFAATPPEAVPLPDVFRCLDGLARTGDRERYRRLLADHGSRVGARPVSFDRLNEFCRAVKSALAWVAVAGRGSGSGFLVTDRHLVTNRHVVADGAGPAAVESDRVRAFVAGEWRTVRSIRCPADPEIDLAVLELSAPPGTDPVRIGHSRLVEIGEHVLALGFPTPEGDSFDDNLLADHGIVNRIRGRRHGPELELGLRINPGMSGGPVFNDRGEVVGVVTLIRFVTGGTEGNTVVLDRTSHAIAVDPLAELLPRPWSAPAG